MAFEEEEEEEGDDTFRNDHGDMSSEQEEEDDNDDDDEVVERVWASERARASQEVADMNAFRPMTSGQFGDARKSWDSRGVAEKKGANNDEV